jgi:hypothetical protein
MSMRELQFTNEDAKPKEAILNVSTESIAAVMTWYGGYHSGDDYVVHVDGVEVKKDQNGELVGDLP